MRIFRFAIVAWILVLGACGPLQRTSPTPEIEIQEGLAGVEAVEVVMLMSFPLQVHLQVSGYLADPCTLIDQVITQRDGYAFEVSITTKRDPEAVCIQVLEPFTKSVPLDVYGLPAGAYSVLVNGIGAEFTFNQDNILGE